MECRHSNVPCNLDSASTVNKLIQSRTLCLIFCSISSPNSTSSLINRTTGMMESRCNRKVFASHFGRLFVLCILQLLALTHALRPASIMPSRRGLLNAVGTVLILTSTSPDGAVAFQQPQHVGMPEAKAFESITSDSRVQPTIAYKQLSLRVPEFGVNVPIAAWFPMEMTDMEDATTLKPAHYQHRISVRRIGQLLARWDFIPEFVSRNYNMSPSSTTVRVVESSALIGLPARGPVVLLAHGYQGSRFDLSHLAEELAANGFICIAAEYPESLAASYERVAGLDRRAINDVLLHTMAQEWRLQASAYGIVGHSMGCGTVAQTGDSSWARVSIAGFPQNSANTNGLLLASMNDGAVSIARRGGAALISSANYKMLQEAGLATTTLLPRRAALVFDRPDAPNHISFLAEGVNDAMIELLSPLLPVAKAISIPVLDFDRYQVSRDSKATAAVVIPLVLQYLKQEMKMLPTK